MIFRKAIHGFYLNRNACKIRSRRVELVKNKLCFFHNAVDGLYKCVPVKYYKFFFISCQTITRNLLGQNHKNINKSINFILIDIFRN